MRNLKRILIVLFTSFTCIIFGQNNSLNNLSNKLKFINSKSIELRKNTFKVLDSIAEIIKKDNLYYEIQSHSGMIGNSKFNLIKTQKRARLIKKELIKRGIKSDRLKSVGYGKSNLIFSPSTRDQDYINERILIKRLKSFN